MAATVVWIGGLFYQAVILGPSISKLLTPNQLADLLRALRTKFQPLAWLSLAVLVATGLTQMTGNPNYAGFLVIEDRWAVAMIAKHSTIALMFAVAIYQTWFLHPELERAAFRQAAGQIGNLADRQLLIQRINIGLSLVVLALTALARTA